MNVATKQELNTVREAFELNTKEILRKNAQIKVLKKQLEDLLDATDANPHPCNNRLVGEIESSKTLLETMA